MNALQPLADLATRGMQPVRREVWLGLGFKPMRRNAIEIDPAQLPTDSECNAVTGLDVIVCIRGYATAYGKLQRLCGALYQARPRRLQVVDHDHKKIAFLKLAGRP
ncbi:hypothetical protein BH11PSE11_BH11PSE11_12310 [soil metagenome]